MSNIIGVIFDRFRNSELFQFHTENIALLTQCNPDNLKVRPEFDRYVVEFNELDVAFKKTKKSSYTELIKDADNERDKTRTGMYFITKGHINNHDAETAAAAKRVDILISNTYGNINKKSYNEQTGDITNMIQDLKSNKYAQDIEAIGLTGWVNELERRNDAVQELVTARANEKTEMPDTVVKEARAKTDGVYREIVNKINALALIEGPENYSAYIRGINEIIKRYENTIKTRAGRAKKKGGAGGGEGANGDDDDGLDGDGEV